MPHGSDDRSTGAAGLTSEPHRRYHRPRAPVSGAAGPFWWGGTGFPEPSTSPCISRDPTGRRTTNSLPWPEPGAGGADAPAVQLDQLPDQGQPDPQPPLGAVERAVRLGEQVEDRAAAAPARCRSRCRGRGSGGLVLAAGRPASIRPPRLGVLGGVVQEVRKDLLQPGRVRLQRHGLIAGDSPTARGGGRLDQRPCGLDGAVDDRRAARHGSLRSWILPRLIRETSSRSSTSRVRCRTCRSATSRACSDVGLSPSPRSMMQRVEDRRQRVAQLVGQHRQELVLAAVGLADLAVKPAHFR